MEWNYCHDGVPKDAQPVWIARDDHSVVAAFYAPKLPAYLDNAGNEIGNPYAWMPREEGQEAPVTPYGNRNFPLRCPSGREHHFANFTGDEHTPPDPNAQLFCSYCGKPGPKPLTQARVVRT